MVRATGKGVVRDLLNKLAKYLGEGTSRKAAEGDFRRFSFWALTPFAVVHPPASHFPATQCNRLILHSHPRTPAPVPKSSSPKSAICWEASVLVKDNAVDAVP